MTTATPLARSRRFNLLSEKKAMERPSSDQNGDVAPSVPVRGCASIAETRRTQMRGTSVPPAATNANCDPSGESARNDDPRSVDQPPAGGDTAKRIAPALPVGAGRAANHRPIA